MRYAYLLSVWLHLIAAITWIGGMLFLVMVVVPALRSGDRQRAVALMRDAGQRFRGIGWACFGVLLLTGLFNLWFRGVRLAHFADVAWLASPFGHAVAIKLLLFVLVLANSAVHDFWVGPRATLAMQQDPRGAEGERLRRLASYLGRANVVVALLLVLMGVIIVRGWP